MCSDIVILHPGNIICKGIQNSAYGLGLSEMGPDIFALGPEIQYAKKIKNSVYGLGLRKCVLPYVLQTTKIEYAMKYQTVHMRKGFRTLSENTYSGLWQQKCACGLGLWRFVCIY
jgi:hypothetical protein